MKMTIKKAYCFLLGALAAAALLFTTCDNVLTQPEIQPENNYTRVKINLVGEEDPLDPQNIARTTFPDLNTDVTYEYSFKAKDSDGKYTVDKGVVKPNTDNEFLLPPGDYEVTVTAFDKSSYVDVGSPMNKKGALGKATFIVPPPSSSVISVTVRLEADPDAASTVKGIIYIAFDYPPTATPKVFLKKAEDSIESEIPNSSSNPGTYTATVTGKDPGSYRLRITIQEDVKSTGTIEAIHVYPNLKTTYRKTFDFTDLSNPITIPNVALTIPEPRQGVNSVTDPTKVKYTGAYEVQTVTWTGTDAANAPLATTTTFTEGCTYTVVIALKANTGYNFAGLSNATITNATINGQRASLKKADPDNPGQLIDGDPVTGDTVTLLYQFPVTKTVDTITIETPPKLTYSFRDLIDLSLLYVKLHYTDTTESPAIPFADFSLWNIQVFQEDKVTPLSLTTPLTNDFNNKKITIKCNGKDVQTSGLIINPKSLSDEAITIIVPDQTYTGLPLTPTVTSVKDGSFTLIEDTDYTVEFSDEVKKDAKKYTGAVIIKAVPGSNYKDQNPVDFKINPQPITSATNITITVSTTPAIMYNGEPQTPPVTVKNTTPGLETDTLVKGTDYTLEFSDNTNVSTSVPNATAIITGIGNYTGTKSSDAFSIGKGRITADTVKNYLTVTGAYKDGEGTWHTYDGTAKKVTVALKSSKMTGLGTIRILYDGVDGNDGITGVGTPNTKNVKSYAVTMTMTAGDNFEATSGSISLGNLVIDKGTLDPKYFQDIPPVVYNGNQQKVDTTAINLVTGHDAGSIGVVSDVMYTYPGTTTPSTSVPRDAGTYKITVKVESGKNFKTYQGEVGQLIIQKKTPMYYPPSSDNAALSDFNVNGDGQVPFDGSRKTVIVTPKVTAGTPPTGGNQMTGTGAITVYYTDTTNNTITTTPPSAQGTYWITFDVAGGDNFESGVGLGATNITADKISLVIGRSPPAMEHFVVTPDSVIYDGSAKPVTVAAKTGIVGMGAISNIRYTRTLPSAQSITSNAPTNAGTYAITVDVAQGANYQATPTDGIIVGYLDIGKKTPVAADFDIKGPGTDFSMTVPVTAASKAVAVTLKTPISGNTITGVGAITVKYKIGTAEPAITVPSAVGTYPVTFDVDATGTNFTAATGLPAGTLTITAAP